MSKKIKLVVLLSGGGTTLENIFTHIEKGLPAEIALVISSKPGVKGLEGAKKHGINTAVISSSDFRRKSSACKVGVNWKAMSNALNDVILPIDPDLVCMAGFMCKYIIPPELNGKVMNIHPALIPSFCGHGMYGHRVHEAVITAGVKISGCTVHFANNEYDSGPIIIQRACPVFSNDTVDDIAARVFAEECIAYPEAIKLFAEDRLFVKNGIVAIKGSSNES